ncbi:hypothetical protein AYO21_02524 [Fonsecaea monophora]|uniref:Uncharacterized protein n=1 Tax=Fonsecaea monophora TaxID=254056 RepID=A0A177FG81_9EURO|nr:hypothetical protein AYO21_02524 [Fonsecaea monophora]KAH0848437.1 hypothetical protein FOPE_02586 [Fonsecaea pedrosoi]OAG43238.1 hypothetical protein AYO21_02524 [Fonsecaea monophora]
MKSQPSTGLQSGSSGSEAEAESESEYGSEFEFEYESEAMRQRSRETWSEADLSDGYAERVTEERRYPEDFSRIDLYHADFPQGLLDRNVALSEHIQDDPFADKVPRLESVPVLKEQEAEDDPYGPEWIIYQAMIHENFGENPNQSFYHRTLMVDMIMRNLLNYSRRSVEPDCLEFRNGKPWTCPPMPTRAFAQGGRFLAQPKPELAVCFRRETVIPDRLWHALPRATKMLACFEGVKAAGAGRIFHFVAAEATDGLTSTNDNIGSLSSLNDASQALHNMFEFFRDAGHEDVFFAKVRFFSMVAGNDGVWVRMHRAVRVPPRKPDDACIMPTRRAEYPLKFEFRNWAHITRAKLEIGASGWKIIGEALLGYGIGLLRGLIHDAAQALVVKLERDIAATRARGDVDFYRYGQTVANARSSSSS